MYQRRSQSPQLYDRFCKEVRNLCDRVMWQCPAWRDRYYATGIDKILLIILELDKRQKHNLLFQNSGPDFIEHNSNAPGYNNTEAFDWEMLNHQSMMDTSPTTIDSSSPAPSFLTGVTDSANTSPSTVQAVSDVISSPTSSDSNTREVFCDQCGKSFRGGSRSSNLLRHQRTAKIHNKSAMFGCLKRGCDTKFSRSDNMMDHVRKVHPQFTHLEAESRAAVIES